MTKEQEEAIEYLKKYKYDNEVYNAINIVLSMLEEKDKVIDLMLDKFIEGTEYYYSEFDYMDKKEVKQYFENKAKEK